MDVTGVLNLTWVNRVDGPLTWLCAHHPHHKLVFFFLLNLFLLLLFWLSKCQTSQTTATSSSFLKNIITPNSLSLSTARIFCLYGVYLLSLFSFSIAAERRLRQWRWTVREIYSHLYMYNKSSSAAQRSPLSLSRATNLIHMYIWWESMHAFIHPATTTTQQWCCCCCFHVCVCVCVCTPMVYPDSIAVEYNYHEISEIIIPFTVETFFSLKKEETFLFVAPPHQMFFFFLRGGFGRWSGIFWHNNSNDPSRLRTRTQ